MVINLTKKDVVWSYIGNIFSLGANIIMLPFIIGFLDDDMLGLWYVFASVGSIATLFDFGFSVTFSRNITYCWSGAKELKADGVVFAKNSEPDFDLMSILIVTCKRIYLVIALFVLLLMLTIGTNYILYISQGINGYKHILAWFIYAMGVFLSLYYGYYSSFLRGVGAIDAVNKNIVLSRIVQIASTVLFLFCGTGIIGACIGQLLYGALFRILGKYKFYRYCDIGNRLKNVTKKPTRSQVLSTFHTVWHNAWRDGLISISLYLSDQASTIICSLYLSLAETGSFSLGVQMATAVASISATMYNAYQPVLQESYIVRNTDKLNKTMSLIIVSFILIFGIGALGAGFVALPILKLIKPTSATTGDIFGLLLLNQFILKFRNCYTSYFSSTNRLPYVKAFVASSIIGVILSALFTGLLNLGEYGIVIGQIISQLGFNAWYWPMKAHQELKLSLKETAEVGAREFYNVLIMILRR